MLGRHHVSLSLLTVLAALMPLLVTYFLDSLALFSILFIAVYVGSLLPDVDVVGGRPMLYYQVKPIYYTMLPFSYLMVFFFRIPFVREILHVRDEVAQDHRKMTHSLIGIFLSSLFLAFIVFLFLLWLPLAPLFLVLVLFFGLFFGQFLHVLEDSLTKTGVDWGHPFTRYHVSGNIITPSWNGGASDSYFLPPLYQFALIALCIALAVYTVMIDHALQDLIAPVAAFGAVTLAWFFFFVLAGARVGR